jgi:Zn-dependent protease with chaperone function
MSVSIPALFCDGATAASHAVTVDLPGDGTLRFHGAGLAGVVPLAAIRATSRLAQVPRFLALPQGGSLEVAASAELDAALDCATAPSRLAALLHVLESHSRAAAAATLLLVALVGVSLSLGLPRLARHVAFALPVELEKQAGRTGLAVFSRQLRPSTLRLREERQATDVFRRMTNARAGHVPPTLLIRAMSVPNAFAFPGGTVVVSDQLVRLALAQPNGSELLAAVYAHELGHIERRHGLQTVLRNSAALIAVATITGDLSTLTSFSGTLPFLLLQRGYAREFELEADADAAVLLRSVSIKPTALADMLELLEHERPKTGPDFTYLSTHPSTAERIKRLRDAK